MWFYSVYPIELLSEICSTSPDRVMNLETACLLIIHVSNIFSEIRIAKVWGLSSACNNLANSLSSLLSISTLVANGAHKMYLMTS